MLTMVFLSVVVSRFASRKLVIVIAK